MVLPIGQREGSVHHPFVGQALRQDDLNGLVVVVAVRVVGPVGRRVIPGRAAVDVIAGDRLDTRDMSSWPANSRRHRRFARCPRSRDSFLVDQLDPAGEVVRDRPFKG
ncbi:MAG: hypothetical protein MZV64_10485 [Ignavibacteriales bacterium]|nr:hypothetical protein [Ignavibacteriales bacterium]